jgi:hypothetical protein
LKPAIRFTLPDGEWNSEIGDSPQHFAIAASEPPGKVLQAIIGAHRIDRVYDPRKGGRIPGDQVPLREGFADWLRAHPRLRTSKPRPVHLLGLDGVQIDVRSRSQPPQVPDECGKIGEHCVPLFYDGIDPIAYADGTRGRFIVLRLPSEDELVIEQFVESRNAFAAGLDILRPVLDGWQLAEWRS